jgi:hypothetical protein
MKVTQYRELTGLETVRPLPEDVAVLMKNAAYVRWVQIIFEKLNQLYVVLVQGSISEAESNRIRGHIIALEEVLGVHERISSEAKTNAAKSKPEDESQDGEFAFRAALTEQKEKNNV